MMRMKDRRLTVYYAYSAKDEKMPCIRLQGKWLQKLGIEPGDAILVCEDEGRLVIELDQKGVYDELRKNMTEPQGKRPEITPMVEPDGRRRI